MAISFFYDTQCFQTNYGNWWFQGVDKESLVSPRRINWGRSMRATCRDPLAAAVRASKAILLARQQRFRQVVVFSAFVPPRNPLLDVIAVKPASSRRKSKIADTTFECSLYVLKSRSRSAGDEWQFPGDV